MIRVKRPDSEPSAVTPQRNAGLKLALAAYDAASRSPLAAVKKTLENYDGGKEALYRAQHRKCVLRATSGSGFEPS